jgi:hypothetical protein
LTGGIFTMAIGFVMMLATTSVTVHEPPPVAVHLPEIVFADPVVWQQVLPAALIPAALTDRPTDPEEKVEPADNVETCPGADNDGRETFGTTVEFVRNPLEAGRIAGAERRLAFHLHVSGNFEDEAFT